LGLVFRRSLVTSNEFLELHGISGQLSNLGECLVFGVPPGWRSDRYGIGAAELASKVRVESGHQIAVLAKPLFSTIVHDVGLQSRRKKAASRAHFETKSKTITPQKMMNMPAQKECCQFPKAYPAEKT
jgi:hypothetical protein